MVKRFLRHVAAIGLTTFLVGGLYWSDAHADIISCESGCSLQYLVDNPTTAIQVGDKLFFDFFASSAAYNASAVDLSAVIVTPRIDPNGHYGHTEYGLSFQLPSGSTVTGEAGDAGKDLQLAFAVTTTFYPEDLIIDDYLSFSGYVFETGQIDISEIVTDENGNFINVLAVWMDYINGQLSAKTVDSGLFDPQNVLLISKDVHWEVNCPTSEPCDGRAFISDFTQMFSQRPWREIPEPSSMILLGLGLLGFGVAARKRLGK